MIELLTITLFMIELLTITLFMIQLAALLDRSPLSSRRLS